MVEVRETMWWPMPPGPATMRRPWSSSKSEEDTQPIAAIFENSIIAVTVREEDRTEKGGEEQPFDFKTF